MLNAIKHRGLFRRVEFVERQAGGVIAVGCVSHDKPAQNIARTPTAVAAVHGSLYEERTRSNAEYVLRRVKRLSAYRAVHEVTCKIGGFGGLVGCGDRLYGFRDVNGLKPLYYAHSPHLTVFASERKAIWSLGMRTPQPVPPGSALNLSRKGMRTTRMVQFSRPREKKITFHQASSGVHRLLSRSIRRVTRQVGKTCVAFSGGLDSALTAAMAKRAGVDIDAISIGLAGSSEVSTAEQFAKRLGLNLTLEVFPVDSVEEYVRRVLWLIEEPNLMKLSVAIPLHWAAKVAARCGYKVMLCGQGSDELYGGYNKYANTLKLRGRRALSDQLYASVIESSTVNYERDDQATSPYPVELRTPFADPDLIKFSLSIPSEFKVKDGNDAIRKWVLRDVARKVGLPEEIVWRRKKAIQHGSGVEKAILKLAKSRGLKPDDYLKRTFEEVRMMDSIP